MNLLFVYPNIVESPKDISTGLATLVAVCKKKGHKAILIDSSFGILDKEILQRAKKFKPDVGVITTATNDFGYSVHISSLLKKHFKIPIIVGGFHPTIAPEEVISKDCFDALCIGEGEEALIEYLDELKKKKPKYKIRNLWVKTNEKNKHRLLKIHYVL